MGHLAGTFKRNAVRKESGVGENTSQASFCLFLPHCKLCFWMHIHRTRRALLHKAQTRNKARKTGERRCESVLSFNFHFHKALNSPNGFSFMIIEYLLYSRYYVKHLTSLVCKMQIITISVS